LRCIRKPLVDQSEHTKNDQDNSKRLHELLLDAATASLERKLSMGT
jgi:hypothetical protein